MRARNAAARLRAEALGEQLAPVGSAMAAASPRSIAAAALTKRSRSSAPFVGPHAAGPVARESPIVSR